MCLWQETVGASVVWRIRRHAVLGGFRDLINLCFFFLNLVCEVTFKLTCRLGLSFYLCQGVPEIDTLCLI